MARPLIENCDIDRWVRTCRRGHREGINHHFIERNLMATLWAGIDAGKRTDHCVVIDCDGAVVLSSKVDNDETMLLELIAAIIELAGDDEVCWATELTDGGAALLIALLVARDQRLLYIPGRVVHHAAATYRGDGKTDAKDALVGLRLRCP